MGRLQPWLAVLYGQWGGAAVAMARFMAMAVAMAVENEKLCCETNFYAFILPCSFLFLLFHVIAYDNN